MAEKQEGFFWHVHHEMLLEWCYGYDERKQYIQTNKPDHEIDTRLRLFKTVMGSLPEEVVTAEEAYVKAEEAHNKAWEAYITAGEVYDKAWKAYITAEEAYVKAGEALVKALQNNWAKIEELHRKECPNCPWDGHTIFPNS